LKGRVVEPGRALSLRIVGRKMPGLVYGKASGALVERSPVYVGVQKKGGEVVSLVRGDAPQAVFDLSVGVDWSRSAPTGAPDFRGPFVHGKTGDRFLYLSWGQLDPDGTFTMFRRAKLHLSKIRREVIVGSLSSAEVPLVEASLDMTDEHGGPICGSAADRALRWDAHSPRAGR
jgi:hypothetical protein